MSQAAACTARSDTFRAGPSGLKITLRVTAPVCESYQGELGGLLESSIEKVKFGLYWPFRRTPFRPWYRAYKKSRILAELRAGRFNASRLPEGYGQGIDERIVEYTWMFSRLASQAGKLLDAGSVLNFDYLLEHPLLRSKQIFICTLAPEQRCFWSTGASYVYGDLRRTCFRDNYFDWIVSLSTLEHIGMDNTTHYVRGARPEKDLHAHLEAVREWRRILRPGGTLYLSFPFGSYADHGWFQVFNAEMLVAVIDAFSPARAEEHHFKWEPSGWQVSSRQGSATARYYDWHRERGYRSDLPVAAGAVACLELEK